VCGFVYCDRSFDIAPVLALTVQDAANVFEDPEFFGNDAARSSYLASLDVLRSLGAQEVRIDYKPFVDACRLVFGSTFIAERWLTYRDVISPYPDSAR